MANLWKTFEELLPKKKFIIGTVNSVDSGSGTSTITLLSGQQITVKGTEVSVGQRCLVQDGIIIQQVPSLTLYNVTIY